MKGRISGGKAAEKIASCSDWEQSRFKSYWGCSALLRALDAPIFYLDLI